MRFIDLAEALIDRRDSDGGVVSGRLRTRVAHEPQTTRPPLIGWLWGVRKQCKIAGCSREKQNIRQNGATDPGAERLEGGLDDLKTMLRLEGSLQTPWGLRTFILAYLCAARFIPASRKGPEKRVDRQFRGRHSRLYARSSRDERPLPAQSHEGRRNQGKRPNSGPGTGLECRDPSH